METDLPALCRRVWGRVPEVRPHGPDWEMSDNLLQVVSSMDGGHFYYPKDGTSYIRDACLRWLLDQSFIVMDQARDGSSVSEYKFEQRVPSWYAVHSDLTTCLLLAVERCHEYKNKENK